MGGYKVEIINSNLNFRGNLFYTNNPKMVILHHADAERCTIQDINHWHLQNGWAGCGYHYFVSKDGKIYSGRDEKAEGAHCYNYNDESIGICAEGNFNYDVMSELQYNALKEITQSILRKYGLNKIYGHRELYSTDCPGKNFPLDRIKRELATVSNSTSGPGYNLIMNADKYDANVKTFQQKLISKGYDLGKYGADGYFGPMTSAAVVKFQKANELAVDGIVGVNTWNKLVNGK
jgi:N-acetyl-anhydromuramyl-L-alanine amidase AmpD